MELNRERLHVMIFYDYNFQFNQTPKFSTVDYIKLVLDGSENLEDIKLTS